MNKFIMLLVLCVSNCGGKDGENGAPGKNGKDGKDGINGLNGQDGTDNHIVSKIYCSGDITSTTAFNDAHVVWDAITMSSGDVMIAASIKNIGQFNVSGTAFYAATQSGASDGTITLYPDDANAVTIKYYKSTDNVAISIVSSNGNGGYYSNYDACTAYDF